MSNDDRPHQSNLRKGRVSLPFGLYFITKCLPSRHTQLTSSQRTDVVESLKYHRSHGEIYLHAFVVMPDHWHGLYSLAGSRSLSETVHRINRRASFPSRQKGSSTQWEEGFFDHKVRENESVVGIVNYIEANPVRKGLAEKACQWEWSSAHPRNAECLDRTFLGYERWS